MKRKMHVRTLAIIVATLSVVEVSRVARITTKDDNIVYAAESDTTTSSAVTTSTNAINSVSISGTERVGKKLKAKVTFNTGVSAPTVKYQWLKCSDKDGTYREISGATDSEYKLRSSDEDDYIKVRVTSNINEGDSVTSSRTSDIDDRSSSDDDDDDDDDNSSSTADSDDIKDDIKDADNDDDDTVTENIDDEPKIEDEVFEYLKNHDDVTLVLSGDDYEWTFKGKDIEDPSVMGSKLDTRVDTDDSSNESDIKKLTKGADVVNLNFRYSGKLPGKAKVEIDNIGAKYNGDEMYLYYYNEDTKSLELVESNVKVEDGKVVISIDHCSDYILSKDPIGDSKVNNVTNTNNTNKVQSQNSWTKLKDGTWQYIKNGASVKGWNYLDNKWYYMNNDGKMQTGWLTYNGSWYYLNNSGDMATGWINISGNWYYLESNGAMSTGWKVINGQWQYFNDNGIWQ